MGLPYDDGSGGRPDPEVPTGGAQITNITKANPAVVTINGSATLNFIVGDDAYFSGVGGMLDVNGNHYPVTAITGGGASPWVVTLTLDSTGFGTYTGGGMAQKYNTSVGVSTTGIATCYNNLFDVGAYNMIAWSAVSGAQRYYVYKLENGLYGYLGQTTSLSFKDDNIAPDLSKTPPIQTNPFVSAGNYPATTAYFEQRRCFASTINDPAYFWATRSGTESNLAYSIPSRDDDSIRFRIAARERSEIRHIVSMQNLILLSESVEWRVTPAGGDVLTPDVSVRPQSAIGCGYARPVVVNNNILFGAARGGHVRELGFNQDAGGYITGDICLRAPHLFDDYSVVDMAYAKAPLPIVWCVSSSGKLLGVTYVPEQQVGPWHQHDTQDGVFESICVVPEGDADVLYAVIARETEARHRAVHRTARAAPVDRRRHRRLLRRQRPLLFGLARNRVHRPRPPRRQGRRGARRRRCRRRTDRQRRLSHARGSREHCPHRAQDHLRHPDPAGCLRGRGLRARPAEEHQQGVAARLYDPRHQGRAVLLEADRVQVALDRGLRRTAFAHHRRGRGQPVALMVGRRRDLHPPRCAGAVHFAVDHARARNRWLGSA
jgi:hypothetical protein